MSGRNKLLEERNLFAHGFGGNLVHHSGEGMAKRLSHNGRGRLIHVLLGSREFMLEPMKGIILKGPSLVPSW